MIVIDSSVDMLNSLGGELAAGIYASCVEAPLPVVVDLKAATTIAEGYLSTLRADASDWKPELIGNATMEREFGWVFFYGCSDPSILIAGYAPFIVDRRDGTIHVTGTAYPTEKYLESYARVGRTYPFATPEELVILERLKPGISKLSLAKTIHAATSKSIEDAKRFADKVLDGQSVVLSFSTATEAAAFCGIARQLGALTRRETRFR